MWPTVSDLSRKKTGKERSGFPQGRQIRLELHQRSTCSYRETLLLLNCFTPHLHAYARCMAVYHARLLLLLSAFAATWASCVFCRQTVTTKPPVFGWPSGPAGATLECGLLCQAQLEGA